MFIKLNIILLKNITALSIVFLSICISINAQVNTTEFTASADVFFRTFVKTDVVEYAKLKNNPSLNSLIKAIEDMDLSAATANEEKAFYINAYNLLGINQVSKSYPVSSVKDITNFFDLKHSIAGQTMSLNQIEHDFLFKKYPDPRLHFVLVCGAVSCPPITDFAYSPDKLEEQMDQQTKLAVNNPIIIEKSKSNLNVSQIFKWYQKDFGGSEEAVQNFINKYRRAKFPTGLKLKYQNYDWTLNDLNIDKTGTATEKKNNANRYIVSSTIPKGTFEIKLFNNLYTQQTGANDVLIDRSNFFTSTLSVFYGLTNRFNVGINTRYRQVSNDKLPVSALKVLSEPSRTGLTAIGPQIRVAPVPKWENFSIQSSFVFPVGKELEGNYDDPNNISDYIDWDGPTWWTQFFNDFPIGNNFSIFTEVDFIIDDLGAEANGHLNRISTPITLIFSSNPTPKLTVYAIGAYSPYWQETFDYFYQGGLGAKYQFTPKFEIELLYSDFTNKFLNDSGGQAATYNLGLRVNI